MSHTCPGVAGYCLLAAGWLIAAPRASPSAQSSPFAAFPILTNNNIIEIKSTFYKNTGVCAMSIGLELIS